MIVLVIARTMFTVLSSWHCHCHEKKFA